MRRLTLPVATLGLALTLVRCSDSNDPQSTGPLFVFRNPATQAIVRLEITNPSGLNEANALLASGAARWALGTPRRGDGGINAPWSWHIDPASVTFAEVTIEACQAAASAIADDLDYWMSFGQVCIWGVIEARER